MKRIFASSIAALLLTLTACGSPQTPDTSAPSDSRSTAAEQPPAPTDENGDIVIRLAVNKYMGYEVDKAIREFNELDNGYHIQKVFYDHESVYNSGNAIRSADMKLQMDIMNGDVVDMVADNAFEEVSRYEILTQKGAFADLYPFLDGDTGTNRSELHAHVLELHETDEQLCQMPMYFYIQTVLGLTEDVGTKENWTFDEMLMHWEAMPEGSVFSSNNTKLYVYNHLIRGNLSAFVDYKNATCSFDSPEFVEMLEFCNSFDVIYDKSQPDGRNPNFVRLMVLDCFNGFHFSVGSDEGEEYTLVGYPTNEGNGAFLNTTYSRYAICADTPPEVQEGAWAFIRTLADEDFCCDISNAYNNFVGFPVNRAAFERLAQEELNRPEAEQYSYGNMTQAEYERLCAYIQSIDRINDNIDDALETIVNEEIDLLFKGECTAQQCADMIQSRASLYISERS